VTAVWRAGLAGRTTDHDSICFELDPATGVLGRGSSSSHWYRLGWRWFGRVDASSAGREWAQHPQSGAQVSGVHTVGKGLSRQRHTGTCCCPSTLTPRLLLSGVPCAVHASRRDAARHPDCHGCCDARAQRGCPRRAADWLGRGPDARWVMRARLARTRLSAHTHACPRPACLPAQTACTYWR
jgi:hypothetical protein